MYGNPGYEDSTTNCRSFKRRILFQFFESGIIQIFCNKKNYQQIENKITKNRFNAVQN